MIHFNDDLLATLLAGLPKPLPDRIGIAVSGGGDSVALLHMASRALAETGCTVLAATVDHGLRPEAAAEATQVAELAASLGIEHSILNWQGWDRQGNLQDQARRARYRLLSGWAQAQDIPVLLTGHTADDQAETVLMRLARSSGVSGLSGMPAMRDLGGVTLLRPLLGVSRKDLRCYLRRQELSWAEDPSNDDTRFDRIKARQALEVLAPLGITGSVLTDVARNMAQAREALERYAEFTAQIALETDMGDVLVDAEVFAGLPEEIRRRLLIGAVCWVSGEEYPPRRAAIDEAMGAIAAGMGATLSGCRILLQKGSIRICRELSAVENVVSPAGEVWDARWRVFGPDSANAVIRPLGEAGLALCPDWRATGRPHAALIASPSVWIDDSLVSAPLAGFDNGWALSLILDEEALFNAFLSH
ncbi:tRNA lysidine(34) synthetase TilS [Ruegeria sp. 2012CJ41-6]|uniref:tRNA(Ile)-lysidine synthase n=1 Tax=Ruegeria spongiae TaxID=2942209 RepID=A0ABT0Q1Y1_9RHOB|nr:tRNA lysidine(34) synthetase TilS [Ruegeria spongiae]MCL6283885.1 tRNA lysidine(34) synthetase TilS [Ruegeria spongiae]